MTDVGVPVAAGPVSNGDAPVQTAPPSPQGVILGAGGDPLMISLPIFCVGSLALGFALVGVVPPAGLGSIIPVIAAATAVFLFLGTIWAFGLGQSIVASISGIFAGFWGSLAVLLLGLDHSWFAVPAANVVHAELLYFISWDILFLFLMIVMLRLPLVYPGILVFVLVAVTLVILGLEFPGSVSTLDHLAGIAVFVFAGLGLIAFLNVGSVSMGGPPWPPVGPPVIKS